jgi:hypothetical protein
MSTIAAALLAAVFLSGLVCSAAIALWAGDMDKQDRDEE